MHSFGIITASAVAKRSPPSCSWRIGAAMERLAVGFLALF